MRRLWRRGLVIALLCSAAVLLAAAVDVAAYAWHARWQAGRLLAAVQRLHPGQTTESETIALLRPFDRYLNREEYAKPTPEWRQYSINNQARWYTRVTKPPMESTWRFPPLLTSLWIDVNFRDGMLAFVSTDEAQDNPGFVHPHATHVCEIGLRFEPLHSYCYTDKDFQGYEYSPIGTAELDSKGNVVKEWPVVYQVVTFDERATPEERRRAYALELRCFTSTCESGDKVSQPAPNRKREGQP